MSLPFRYILVSGIRGDQESLSSLAMPEVFGAGSRNLWMDRFSRASQILGYTKQNVTAVTTDTGGSATRLRGLSAFVLRVGTVVSRQLLGVFDDGTDEWEIWKSTDLGVTWTFLHDYGATSVGTIPDFAGLGNQLIITNGVEEPQLWDGTTLADAGSVQLVAPVAAASGAGYLNGTYRWRIIPIKADGTRKVGSVVSNTLQLQLKKVDLTWTADVDAAVKGYELARTLGTNAVFYIVGYIDGRATAAYTDNLIDGDLRASRQMQEFGDSPPEGAYFCEAHKGRMWYGRTDADPRNWWYSDPGIIDSVYQDVNFFSATDAESQSDVSTGATGEFRGMFVIWLERSVWTVSGTGNIYGAIVDWYLRRTDAKSGSVSHRTVAKVPAGAKYHDDKGIEHSLDAETLAYLSPLSDIRYFDGDGGNIISHAKFSVLQTINYAQRAKFFCIPDAERHEVTWVIATGNSAEPNDAVTWNYQTGVWYSRSWPFACGIETDSASASSVLLAGEASTSIGGYCYQLWNGATFNGTAIATELILQTIYGLPEAYSSESAGLLITQDKRWHMVDLVVRGTPTLLIEGLPTEAADDAAAYSSETVVVAATGISRAKFQDAGGQYLVSRGIRLRISSTGQATWSIDGLNFTYQLLKGVKRTFRK